MRTVTAVFLQNSLSAILAHIDQTPDLDPDYPGLIEFKEILIKRVQELQREDPARYPNQDSATA